MAYIFTSESVSAGHPDKMADQISDALLDHFLAFDPKAKVACETLLTTGQVFLAGEVNTETYIDAPKVARDIIRRIGYDKDSYCFSAKSCGVLSAIHEQSPDILQGVDRKDQDQGAGDQGIMFGYAVRDTEHYMPLPIALSHMILEELSKLRINKTLPYLRPDAKAQVSVSYDADHCPESIDTIVLSTQHDEPEDGDDEAMLARIEDDVLTHLIPKVKERLPEKDQHLFHPKIKYCINPTGRFVIGGPHGDTGLTGRKIIVDTYGGKGGHGGGAFSGKDPSKVDRSAAYAARYLAKNLVAAGIADEALIQLSYAIGESEPISFYVNTYGRARVKLLDTEISRRLSEHMKALFDLRPAAIVERLKLRNPIYLETAAYGHMGRIPQRVTKTFERPGEKKTVEVDLFTWEELDSVEAIQRLFPEL